MLLKTNFIMVLFLILGIAMTVNIEAKLNFTEYCHYHKYPSESHLIKTKDGYTLQFFRLQAKNSQIQSREKVIYLQHGLCDTSDTWIVNQEHLAPGFALANQGYDVWVGNTRGNTYSSPVLNSEVKRFWNFSFDEMIEFDLPSAFQYIGNQTGKKIHYIGHSQGTMIMFGALSQRNPIVRSRIASFSALGPVAYVSNVETKLKGIASNKQMVQLMKAIGMKQVAYTKQDVHNLFSLICLYDPTLCEAPVKISDRNITVDNLSRMSVIVGHFPGGASFKDLDHFGQLMRTGKFCKFDYGRKKNHEIYGNHEPPAYNLSNIDFPVHLFAGEYDKLANVKDVNRLYSQMVNSPNKSLKMLQFGHATFIWGKELTYLPDILRIIQNS